MSTDFEDARLFGALEQRVSAAEKRLSSLETKMDEHHTETLAEIRAIRKTLDEQRGGMMALRVIGGVLIAAAGWVEYYFATIRHHG